MKRLNLRVAHFVNNNSTYLPFAKLDQGFCTLFGFELWYYLRKISWKFAMFTLSMLRQAKVSAVNNILGMSNSWNLFLIREHKMGQKNLPCLQHKGLWLCTLWRPVIQHCQTSWTSSSDWNFSFSSPLSGHCDPSWIEKSHCHGWWFLIKYFLLSASKSNFHSIFTRNCNN